MGETEMSENKKEEAYQRYIRLKKKDFKLGDYVIMCEEGFETLVMFRMVLEHEKQPNNFKERYDSEVGRVIETNDKKSLDILVKFEDGKREMRESIYYRLATEVESRRARLKHAFNKS